MTSPQQRQATEKAARDPGGDAEASAPALPDFEAMSRNAGQLVEALGRSAARYLKPETQVGPSAEVGEMVRTLGKVAESWLTDPNRTVEAQTRLSQEFLTLWGSTYQKLQGQQTPPVAAPEPRDNRFAHPDWSRTRISTSSSRAT